MKDESKRVNPQIPFNACYYARDLVGRFQILDGLKHFCVMMGPNQKFRLQLFRKNGELEESPDTDFGEIATVGGIRVCCTRDGANFV